MKNFRRTEIEIWYSEFTSCLRIRYKKRKQYQEYKTNNCDWEISMYKSDLHPKLILKDFEKIGEL